DAFAFHAFNDLTRTRIGRCVIAEYAIKKGLQLRRDAVPINGCCGNEALRRQVRVEKHGFEAILYRTGSIRLSALPAVSEKCIEKIDGIHELVFVPGVDDPIANGSCQRRRVSVTAWARR